MARYRKVIAAALAAVAALASAGLLPHPWDTYVPVLLAAAGTYGVYQAPNDAPAGEAPDPAVSERGTYNPLAVIALLVIVVVVVLLLSRLTS